MASRKFLVLKVNKRLMTPSKFFSWTKYIIVLFLLLQMASSAIGQDDGFQNPLNPMAAQTPG